MALMMNEEDIAKSIIILFEKWGAVGTAAVLGFAALLLSLYYIMYLRIKETKVINENIKTKCTNCPILEKDFQLLLFKIQRHAEQENKSEERINTHFETYNNKIVALDTRMSSWTQALTAMVTTLSDNSKAINGLSAALIEAARKE